MIGDLRVFGLDTGCIDITNSSFIGKNYVDDMNRVLISKSYFYGDVDFKKSDEIKMTGFGNKKFTSETLDQHIATLPDASFFHHISASDRTKMFEANTYMDARFIISMSASHIMAPTLVQGNALNVAPTSFAIAMKNDLQDELSFGGNVDVVPYSPRPFLSFFSVEGPVSQTSINIEENAHVVLNGYLFDRFGGDVQQRFLVKPGGNLIYKNTMFEVNQSRKNDGLETIAKTLKPTGFGS